MLSDDIRNLLNRIVPSTSDEKIVRHGLKMALDRVVSVLSFEITKDRRLHKGRLSTKMLRIFHEKLNNKTLSVEYVENSQNNNKNSSSVATTTEPVHNVVTSALSKWNERLEEPMEEFIEECLKTLWILLDYCQQVLLLRIQNLINEQTWTNLYKIVVSAAATCVFLDVYHQKYSTEKESGIRYILANKFNGNMTTIQHPSESSYSCAEQMLYNLQSPDMPKSQKISEIVTTFVPTFTSADLVLPNSVAMEANDREFCNSKIFSSG
jgi:hypothetical protein